MMVEKFARELEGADVGLLFYAGHALQINEKNYLVSTDARLENEFLIASESIELEPIVRLMESKVADQSRLSGRVPQQPLGREFATQPRCSQAERESRAGPCAHGALGP